MNENIRKSLFYFFDKLAREDVASKLPFPDNMLHMHGLEAARKDLVTCDLSTLHSDWQKLDQDGLSAINTFMRDVLVMPNDPRMQTVYQTVFGIMLRATSESGNKLMADISQAVAEIMTQPPENKSGAV